MAVIECKGAYQIRNAGQLYWFAQQVNSGNTAINGKLMADIVINENVLNENGELRTILPMAVVLDERIADGFYFVRSFKYFEWLMQHPEELKKPLSELGDYTFD